MSSENEQQMIFNIQRFSTHDGEGIRTMIFFKGCPLSCWWCCNPESQSFVPGLMYNRLLCKNFGDCLKTGDKGLSAGCSGIEIDRAYVQNIDDFRDICASKALFVSGEDLSTEQILYEIGKDEPFYMKSGGGVTLSGGEPLSQEAELDALLLALKRKAVDVAIETSLHVDWERIESVRGLTDTFLVDLKHSDSDKFNRFTGGDALLVMNNLMRLSGCHENIIVRIPVIPGFNHSEPEMKVLIDYTRSLESVREIHFLPYHALGIGKYTMLGMEYKMNGELSVKAEELTGYLEYAGRLGLIAKTGG